MLRGGGRRGLRPPPISSELDLAGDRESIGAVSCRSGLVGGVRMNSKVIGQKVRTIRSKMGLTTITLAKKVRFSQGAVSRLENGLQGWRSATLIKFCKVLGVEPAQILAEGADVAEVNVADELEALGLTPSKTLCSAMKNAGFLRFMEKCAKVVKAHKKNQVRMVRALRSVV